MDENKRRFSLEKTELDPALLNRIMSADGDDQLGEWDGESIQDLVDELERIEEREDPNYSSLPHRENIPEDLQGIIEKDYPIWACDRSGNCLTGEHADKIRTVDKIRLRYEKKYGGIEAFKKKIQKEIQERNERMRLNE